jgi:16S rRNA (guanine527-N7)-methyltransferase
VSKPRDRGAPSAAQLVPVVEHLASALGEPVTAEQVAALGAYAELVAAWNARVNLTAARDAESLGEILLADALVLRAHAFVSAGARLIDVGTGAGAPLLPLLVLRPDLRAVGFEPLHKRAAFLRTAAARLGLLERLRIEEARIDEHAEAAAAAALPGAPFDLALSRATFAPEAWLPLGLALAPIVVVLTRDGLAGTAQHERRYALPFSHTPRVASRFGRARV